MVVCIGLEINRSQTTISSLKRMLDPERTRERELILKRLSELDQEIAENDRRLWELKKEQAAHLPLEEQFAFYLRECLHSVKMRPQRR